MDTSQTIREFTIAYIENALTEVALLHDAALIEPTLEKFHIERCHARFHGFAPKRGTFNPRVGFKPRPVYTVTDGNGTPLGDPIHEGDLGTRYTENVIEQQIAANLEAMLTDHADLVALHRAGDGGSAPSFRYRPASSLAERTDTEAALEQQKIALRENITRLRERHETEQQHLRSILQQQKAAELKFDEIDRKTRHRLAQMKEAQRIIDRAGRLRKLAELKEGTYSPGADASMRNDDGPELG